MQTELSKILQLTKDVGKILGVRSLTKVLDTHVWRNRCDFQTASV